MVGFVFSAYPIGTVLSVPLPPLVMQRYGTRATTVLGLLLSACSLLLFGFAPKALPDATPAVLTAVFLASRLLGGVGAALAEASAFTLVVNSGFGSRLGAIMSTVEVVVGLAAAGGTFAGCLLYTSPSPRDS